jgi:hypothetical protein
MRNLVTLALFSLFLCFGALSATAQKKDSPSESDKGDISEIKDKKRVYVIAETPRQTENIVKALNKRQDMFEVVESINSADYVIAYAIITEKAGVSVGAAGTRILDDQVYFGRMSVTIPQKDNSARVVWETRVRFIVSPPQVLPPPPGWNQPSEQPREKSAIAKFIKAIRKARGDK